MTNALLSALTALLLTAPVLGQSGGGKNFLVTLEGKRYWKGRVIRDPAKLLALIARSRAEHGRRLRALPVATAGSFDCRTLGWVCPVLDQGQCGSCWDFSGTEVCTSAYMKSWGTLAPGVFSPQYTLDCYSNGGCNGDDNTTVLAHAKSVGLPTQTDYGPYTAAAGRCKSGVKLWQIQDWMFVDGQNAGDTQKIKDAMVAYGPVGCAVAAGGSDFWNTGAGTDTGTSTQIDHDVLLVGWDDTHDNGDGSKGAWIMQNSWGTSWGSMAGCAWVKYGADSIGTEPVVAIAPPPPGPPPPPPGTPAITSALTAAAVAGQPFSYQITANGAPTSFAASGLPAGLSCCGGAGTISGTPAAAWAGTVSVSATNAAGTGTATLALTVSPAPVPPPGPVQPVAITLTTDQVSAVLAGAGVTVISGDMTARDFAAAISGELQKPARKLPWKIPAPQAPAAQDNRLDILEKELGDVKRGMDAVIKLLLQQQKLSPRRMDSEKSSFYRPGAPLDGVPAAGRRDVFRSRAAAGTPGGGRAL